MFKKLSAAAILGALCLAGVAATPSIAAEGDDWRSGAVLTRTQAPGCYENELHWDTLSGAKIDLPFALRLSDGLQTDIWVEPTGSFSRVPHTTHMYGRDPRGMNEVWSMPLFAPLMATNSAWDVNADGTSVTPVTYGFTQYQGRRALCATWSGMGSQTGELVNTGDGFQVAYAWNYDKKNSFQALIVDRSDVREGAFDLVYNYDSVQWQGYVRGLDSTGMFLTAGTVSAGWTTGRETGPCEGTQTCPISFFDGSYDAAGYPLTWPNEYWFATQTGGSFGPDALLDSAPTGLARTSTNSSQLGRHVFTMRLLPPSAPGSLPEADIPDELADTPWRSSESTPGTANFVALGDSYQSGEGIGSYYANTDLAGVNICHRSDLSAAATLARDPMFADPETSARPVFLNWACSGATAQDLFQETISTDRAPWNDPQLPQSRALYNPTFPGTSQLERITENTAVVTLGVSGNDMGFSDVLTKCIPLNAVKSCVELADGDLRASLAELNTVRSSGEKSSGYYMSEIMGKVRDQSPHASVIVVGYPRFFPPKGGTDTWILGKCAGLSKVDQRFVNSWVDQLNRYLRDWAIRNGAVFVDIADVGAGRELCSGVDTTEWFMNGLDGKMHAGVPIDKGSFHPNFLGHTLITNRIKETLLNAEWSAPSIIDLGETRTIAFSVVEAQDLYVSTSFPGSEITMRVIAPDGTTVADSGSGLGQTTTEATSVTAEVPDAAAGLWTVELYGKSVNPGGEPFVFQHTGGNITNLAPTADFTIESSGMTVTADASAASDPDGSIADYIWDWGDGTESHGAVASHTYVTPGEFVVVLTTVDDDNEPTFASGTAKAIEQAAPTYAFEGFFDGLGRQPAKTSTYAGAYLPLSFKLGADYGDEVLEEGSPSVQQVSCTTGAAIGTATTAAGAWSPTPHYVKSLKRYVWTWKSDQSWSGTCRELRMTFDDGTAATHTVKFSAAPKGFLIYFLVRDRAFDRWWT